MQNKSENKNNKNNNNKKTNNIIFKDNFYPMSGGNKTCIAEPKLEVLLFA